MFTSTLAKDLNSGAEWVVLINECAGRVGPSPGTGNPVMPSVRLTVKNAITVDLIYYV